MSDSDLDRITGLIGEMLDAIPATVTGNTERPCARCGGEVTGRADKRYCSGACRVAGHREQHRPPVTAWPAVECAHCFEVYPQTRPDQRYCSAACKQAAYRDRIADREMVEAVAMLGPILERVTANL